MVASEAHLASFKGIAFPFQKGDTSFPKKAEDSELIRQSIIQILLTERGERLMRPTYGSSLMSRVFDNNDEILKSMLQAEVFAAIGKWEPRAIVRSVDTVQKDTTITVTVNYVVVSTQQLDSVSLALTAPQ